MYGDREHVFFAVGAVGVLLNFCVAKGCMHSFANEGGYVQLKARRELRDERREQIRASRERDYRAAIETIKDSLRGGPAPEPISPVEMTDEFFKAVTVERDYYRLTTEALEAERDSLKVVIEELQRELQAERSK